MRSLTAKVTIINCRVSSEPRGGSMPAREIGRGFDLFDNVTLHFWNQHGIIATDPLPFQQQ